MNRKQFLEFAKPLGLVRDSAHPGLALRGRLEGIPIFIAQFETAVGRDPRPRPLTELRAERASPWQGCLCGASLEYRGDTGDRSFDDRFYWQPQFGLPGTSRPDYLASPRLRQALVSLDASMAAAVGHRGIALFQIDHLEAATRMMILTHLPQASLLERALRLLVEITGP